MEDHGKITLPIFSLTISLSAKRIHRSAEMNHTKAQDKIGRIIQNGSYCSAMNQIKWLKLANAFGDGMRARVKLITEEESDTWSVMTLAACDKYLDGPSYGPVPFVEIEWIDIARSYNHPRSIGVMNAIRDLTLPHVEFEDFIRVFGHVAPGTAVKYSDDSGETQQPPSAAVFA